MLIYDIEVNFKIILCIFSVIFHQLNVLVLEIDVKGIESNHK